MNVSLSLSLALCLSAVTVDAAAAVQPIEVSRESLTIACARPALPRMTDVGRVLGIDNASAIYQARNHLMTQVRQACKRGDATLMARRDNAGRGLTLVAMP
jgi:hypothetical protein